MNFSEIRSIAWKTVAEILGITLTDVVSGTPSSSTYLSGSGAWSVPAGSGAPTNAQYLVGASDATLSAERVVTDTTTVSWDLATAAQAKANVVDASISLAKMADLAQDLFIIRTTASTGVPQTATCTAAARTVLDDATVAAMVDTLGGASSTGSGGLARATSPTFVTPLLGTPTSGVLTNCTGLPEAGLTLADNATNDSSTSKHGFLKKLDNTATNFMSGTGNWAVPAGSGGITLGTEQAWTSGATLDFTGIPAGTKRIVIKFVGVSTSGTSNWMVQIGDAGGIETSGYSGVTNNGGAVIVHSAGYILSSAIVAAATYNATVILELENSSNNTWNEIGIHGRSDGTGSAPSYGTGSKSLSAELTQFRITALNGTDTGDAGVVNYSYES